MFKLLTYLFNLFQTISVCILLDEYLQNNYPELREKYKNEIVNQSYNAIYFYSKAQIILNKYKPYIHKIMEDYPILKKIITQNDKNNIIYDVEFVMDGEVVYKTTKAKMMELNNNDTTYKGEIDFIIYSEHSSSNESQNSIVNRKIIKNIDVKEEDLVCEKSDIKFVLCEFSVGDKKFKVDFKNATSNYYVVDNLFDVKFLKYFLQKYYSEHVKDIDLKLVHDFKINIMDHNIDSVVSNKENVVKLSKENYELVKIE
jgi:hypothetical protein